MGKWDKVAAKNGVELPAPAPAAAPKETKEERKARLQEEKRKEKAAKKRAKLYARDPKESTRHRFASFNYMALTGRGDGGHNS